jgi:hypothetical protein
MSNHHALSSEAGAEGEIRDPEADDAELDSTVAWRRRLLRSAGFSDILAHLLAATPGMDIHALLALVDRGCPPELAARILGPCPDPGWRE